MQRRKGLNVVQDLLWPILHHSWITTLCLLTCESLRESDGRNIRAAWGSLQVLGDRRRLTWYHPGSCGLKAELVKAAVLAGTLVWLCRFLGRLADPGQVAAADGCCGSGAPLGWARRGTEAAGEPRAWDTSESSWVKPWARAISVGAGQAIAAPLWPVVRAPRLGHAVGGCV